jgi:WD40 repeat protein
VWDINTEQMRQKFEGHMADVMAVSVEPTISASVFASCSCDGTVRVWDLRTGKCTISLCSGKEQKKRRNARHDLNDLVLFLGGSAVATAGEDGVTRVFDLRIAETHQDVAPVAVGTPIVPYRVSNAASNSPSNPAFQNQPRMSNILRFSSRQITAMDDSSLSALDRSEYQTFKHNIIDGPISSVAVSRSGRTVFAGHENSILRAWDVSESYIEGPRLPIQAQKTHLDRITTLGTSPNGEYLCSGGWDKQLNLYNVMTTISDSWSGPPG